MTPLKPTVPGTSELEELRLAVQARRDADRAFITARINRDAIRNVVKDRFFYYCQEILPAFVLNRNSFWLDGEHAGEYALNQHFERWTDDGEWLNVHAIGYTKKGTPLKSNRWTVLRFNPAFIAKSALARNPAKANGGASIGIPP